jgi:hypothetical protein
MTDRGRKSTWIIALAAVLALAGLGALFLLGRDDSRSETVELGTARPEPKPSAERATALSEPEARAPVREATAHESSTAPASPAWSFVVVDGANQAVQDAELVRGDRSIARSNSDGGIAVGADLLDVEHAPRGLVWTVRRRGYRATSIDAGRIGRLDRVVLEAAWAVRVHVQDGTGLAVAGAGCILYTLGKAQYDEIARQTSDENGDASFDEVAASRVLLSIRAKGYEIQGKWLNASEASDREVFVLRKGVDLEVRVMDGSGRRIGGAGVNAQYTLESRDSADGPAQWHEVTDARGVAVLASFPRVHAGMQLVVRAPGYLDHGETLAMTEDRARAGIDFVLAPVGHLHVRVHESDGTPREAKVSTFSLSFQSSSQRFTSSQATAIGEYDVDAATGVSLNVFAWIDGAASGCAKDVVVQEGETRDVDIVVPRHVALGVRASGGDGPCGKSDKVTVTAIDGRMGVPYGPAGVPGTPMTLGYQTTLDENCRARLWVQPGSYRVAWIHDGRGMVIREVEIRSSQDLDLSVDAQRAVSGVLRDGNKSPLAGWTVVAHERGGRSSYSAKTSADGRFSIDAVMPKEVELFAVVPDYELSVSVAESIAPPASNLELAVELARVDVHTVSREDGASVASRCFAAHPDWPASQHAERATDDGGRLSLELPVGEWKIFATTGDHGRTGSILVRVKNTGSISTTLYMRKLRQRTFTLGGAGDSGTILWTALEGPDAAEGKIGVDEIGSSRTIETDVPDGHVRFELMRNDELVGKPIEIVVNGGDPIVLNW